MMSKTRIDLYEQWKRDGELDKVMEFIKECSSKLVSQRELCTILGINESTFTKLKRVHPEIQKAINDAKLDLKVELVNSLVKKAVGYTATDEETWIENSEKGEKVRTHVTKKTVPPDYKSIVYLLTKKFGKEFSERYEELVLQERKLNESKEKWSDEVETDD